MACDPTESSLDDSASRENHECRLGPFDDLQRKIEKSRLVHQSASIVATVREEMFDPRPLDVESVEDGLRSCTVGDVGRREMDEQQAAVRIDCDMALAPDDLLSMTAAVVGYRPTDLRRHGDQLDLQ